MRQEQLMTAALCVVALAAGAACERKVEAGPVRSRVMVVGEADAKAQPDTAVVTLSVVTQSKRAVEAQQANARKSEAVIEAAKREAGEGVEVKTSDYGLTPQREWWGGQPRITGYDARNTVTVTVADLDRVGGVIDAATQAGANSVDGIQFVLRETNPARREALAAATRQAMAKAEGMAEALGGRITRVVESQEGNFVPRPGYAWDGQEEHDLSANMNASGGLSARKEAARTPVEAGRLDIKSTVQLIVEIEARPEARRE